jgi:hypothetical protein
MLSRFEYVGGMLCWGCPIFYFHGGCVSTRNKGKKAGLNMLSGKSNWILVPLCIMCIGSLDVLCVTQISGSATLPWAVCGLALLCAR